MKKYFFGWGNFKWLVQELLKVASNKKSYFSKKRLESGLAFIVLQWGMIYFLIHSLDKMTSSDLLIWAGIEFAICGYTLNHIQKEKKLDKEKQ